MWPRRRADPEEELSGLRAEIQRLTKLNRGSPGPETERALLLARHLAGIHLIDHAAAQPAFAAPEPREAHESGGLPESAPAALSPGRLRAAILSGGCLLVRGLIPPGQAESMANEIDLAYERRADLESAGEPDGLYEDFEPHERFGPVLWRAWIEEGGGLLAADSPRLCARMFELFEAARLPALVSGYLGEPALLSVHKTTLRRAEPAVAGAWHQDGAFMGPVRALNLWLALSRCGEDAPGLDLVPRRLDGYLATGTEGAALDWTISDAEARRVAGEAGVLRPVFEPGDALFFDELFLHKTGSEPGMAKPRFAIESWFFGGSAFPADYAPIAV